MQVVARFDQKVRLQSLVKYLGKSARKRYQSLSVRHYAQDKYQVRRDGQTNIRQGCI